MPQEWLKFVERIDEGMPAGLDLHLIVDNDETDKHPALKAWLAKHPRFRKHCTPTSVSWLNLIERFFGELTDKRIRRGTFRSVLELIDGEPPRSLRPSRSRRPLLAVNGRLVSLTGICLPHERVGEGLGSAKDVGEHFECGDRAQLGGAQNAHDDSLRMSAIEGAIAA